MSSPPSLAKRLLILRVWVLWTIGVLTFAGFSIFMIQHWDYYSLPRMERPFHEAHGSLRSSGKVGMFSGIAASTLFVLNLGYLIRKQLLHVKFLGPLRMWMDLHVLTGLVGAGLIAFHATLTPTSALGLLALLALGITVITGLIGRTIYITVPRSVEGRELELQQVQDELDSCRQLLEDSGVQAEWINRSRPQARIHRTGFVGGVVAAIMGDLQRRKEYRTLKQQIISSSELKSAARKVLPLAKDYCTHWQWLIRYHELRRLIASWRFFHRWLAILMLCVVVGHIIVAIRFGDLSIWGGAQ